MTQLFAQPYDISATGFYFETVEEYHNQVKTCRNDYGQPVEEFEIQFIDGTDIDCALFRALDIHQGSIGDYFDMIDAYDDTQKITLIIAVGEAGYEFKIGQDHPDQFDIQIYEGTSMRDLAEEFVDEGLFGEIPPALHNYIDYDAIARDLACDYSQTEIAGTHYIYRIE